LGQRLIDQSVPDYAHQSVTAGLAVSLSTDVLVVEYESRRLAETRASAAAKALEAVAAKLAKDFRL